MLEPSRSQSARVEILVHIAPETPLEVGELTGLLDSIASQYAIFIDNDPALSDGIKAVLHIGSVYPGSINVSFLPDLVSAAGLMASVIEPLKHANDFLNHIHKLLGYFRSTAKAETYQPTIRDCDDAINFAAPINSHGGNQNFFIVKGDVTIPVINLSQGETVSIERNARAKRSELKSPAKKIHKLVALTWSGLDRAAGRLGGQRSPDKAVIEDIDPLPKAVFFSDGMQYLKREMIEDEENPYKQVYFVDVSVSKANNRIASYTIIKFHNKTHLE